MLVVGALRAGGSGKTDWVGWIAARHPRLAILVHPTGDEDRMLASRLPGRVFAADDLLDAWGAARRAGFDAAVSDGGLQDPAFDGSPAILLGEPSARWEELHPFGPFREPRPSRPVDLRLETGRDWTWEIACALVPGSRALLAAGVARTDSVATDLRRAGVEVVGILPVRDHGRIGRRAVARMERIHGPLPWVVTAKDAARGLDRTFERPPMVLSRTLRVPDRVAALVDALVVRLLEEARAEPPEGR